MSEPVLGQDIRTAHELSDETTAVQEAGTGPYVQPVVVSFSLDPHGIESGDALSANG
jgi:hypothetical protein